MKRIFSSCRLIVPELNIEVIPRKQVEHSRNVLFPNNFRYRSTGGKSRRKRTIFRAPGDLFSDDQGFCERRKWKHVGFLQSQPSTRLIISYFVWVQRTFRHAAATSSLSSLTPSPRHLHNRSLQPFLGNGSDWSLAKSNDRALNQTAN